MSMSSAPATVCPRCDLYDCAVPDVVIRVLAVATVVNAVFAGVMVTRSIAGVRIRPRGRLRIAGGASLPLIGVFVLAVPLFILFTAPVKRPKVAAAPVAVTSVVQNDVAVTVTMRPAFDSLAASRPFLLGLNDPYTDVSYSTMCADSSLCVSPTTGTIAACPGHWSGQILSVADVAVDSAPWFFTGDYALCGSPVQGCPSDWGCEWSEISTDVTDGTGALSRTCVAPTPVNDTCMRRIISASARGGALA